MALFVALGGTGAYAANTITSADIVDNEVRTADVRDDTLSGGGLNAKDLKAGSVTTSEVLDESLTNADIKNFSLGNGDFLTGSVDSRAVTDNSLTGDDIDESTLTVPAAGTATFGFGPLTNLTTGGPLVEKQLPAGSWVLIATVNGYSEYSGRLSVSCTMRDAAGGVIGSGKDDREYSGQATEHVDYTITFNGGTYLPNGGTVTLKCSAGGSSDLATAQLLALRVGGFS